MERKQSDFDFFLHGDVVEEEILTALEAGVEDVNWEGEELI